jgi:hypothetical protein
MAAFAVDVHIEAIGEGHHLSRQRERERAALSTPQEAE